MAIIAHAAVRPESRLDVADTQRLTAPAKPWHQTLSEMIDAGASHDEVMAFLGNGPAQPPAERGFPDVHPSWCSGEDCPQPTGELFHTRTVVELDARDADMLADTPCSVDVWMEHITPAGAPAHEIGDAPDPIQVVLTPLGGSTVRAALTPQMALQLARALRAAAGMVLEVGDGS